MRVRFTIEVLSWQRACEYAQLTHRTPSQLVIEALEQIQARYPKKGATASVGDLDTLADRVAERIAQRVPAGTCIPLSSSLSNPDKKAREAKTDYSGVFLSLSEHEELERRYGAKNTAAAVSKLSAYKLAKGKKYRSDYGAILSWAMRSVLEKGGGVPEPTRAETCPECHIAGGNHALTCSRHHENEGGRRESVG